MPDLSLDQSRQIRWYRNAANRGPENLPLLFQITIDRKPPRRSWAG
jgi:hypothetical protein